MKRAYLVALASLGIASIACGGSDKPPSNPDPSLAPTSSATTSKADPTPPTATGSATGPKIDGPAAPTNSDDVKKGIAALKAGDLNGARASFDVAIQKNPKQADAHHYMGLVLEQLGDRPGAEKSYRKALEIQPDLEEPATNLAAILVEAGKNDEAATLMKKAVAKNPKNAALHVNLAMALSGKGDVEGANKSFEEAIKLAPDQGINLVSYAAHLAKNKKNEDAVAKLKQAEKVGANDAGVLASVALEYRGMKDFKTCVAVLDKAVHVKDVAELRVYRGTCKLGLHDLSGATTEFKDAVAKEPNSATAHYSYGNALADGGKLEDAIKEWEATMKLAPDSGLAKGAEKKIEIAKKKLGGGAAPKK